MARSTDATVRPTEAKLTVDLDAIDSNFQVVREHARGAEVAPVVKADAYGLGLAEVATRLCAAGARSYFVARLAEGEALRAACGGEIAIYVLDGCGPRDAGRLLRSRLTPVLNSYSQLADYVDAAPRSHDGLTIQVDTGLQRLGFDHRHAADLARDLRRDEREVGLVISHLACGGEPSHEMNRVQLARFRDVCGRFPAARRSLANSAGVFLGRDYAFDMVRPGVALYGGGPFGEPDSRLRAVATLEAPILQVRNVAAGEPVGYGAAFVASRETRVAIVAAGYADGVLRGSSPGGYGLCDGRRMPLIGRVSMDLLAMDATDNPSVECGACVQLVGAAVPIDDVATAAGTLSYEVFVRLGRRSSRRHIGLVA